MLVMANYRMIVDNSMVNGSSGEETCFRFIVCEVDSWWKTGIIFVKVDERLMLNATFTVRLDSCEWF